MLAEVGSKLFALPRTLHHVLDLEEFEGPLLSELRTEQGSYYLEKWCAQDEGTTRTLIVRTELRMVAEYLAGRLGMLDLLMVPSDGAGFIVDRFSASTRGVYRVALEQLPKTYLPQENTFHDKSLRPAWDRSPQSFLIDGAWDAKLLADTERLYGDIFAFTFLSAHESALSFPDSVFNYNYDGGYPVMHAFRGLREAVPRESRVRAAGVHAGSPGVFTIDAPTPIAEHIVHILAKLPQTLKAYDNVYEWSRLKPDKADKIPVDAASRLKQLCLPLGIEIEKLLPSHLSSDRATRIHILIAGKLVAAYYRKLWKLVESANGAEFINADLSVIHAEPPKFLFEEDEYDSF